MNEIVGLNLCVDMRIYNPRSNEDIEELKSKISNELELWTIVEYGTDYFLERGKKVVNRVGYVLLPKAFTDFLISQGECKDKDVIELNDLEFPEDDDEWETADDETF